MVTTTLKSFSNQSKNVLKGCPSTSSAKKRFEAKLRRVRWRIYQKVQFRKKRLKRHLQYYEKQVQLFLNMFSTKLKPKETSIWTEKLAKTVRDVNTSLSGAKFAKKVPLGTNVKTKPQVDSFFENIMHDYMVKVDSALFMISSILYLVRSGKVEEKSDAPVETASDAPSEAAAAAVDAKEVAEVKEMFEAHNEDNSDNTTVKNFKALSDDKSAKKTSTPVEKDVNAYGVKVTWSVCPQLRHFPVSECRRRCEWDVIALRDVYPSYNEVKPIEENVDKNSEECKQWIKKASSNFVVSSGVVHHKSCPAGFHVGVSVIDCRCKRNAGFPKQAS